MAIFEQLSHILDELKSRFPEQTVTVTLDDEPEFELVIQDDPVPDGPSF